MIPGEREDIIQRRPRCISRKLTVNSALVTLRRWLEWSRKLQAIAQNGLLFTENPYDKERYESIREVAAQMMAAGSGEPVDAITGIFSDQAGYATPKVDVRGVVFRDDQILLVREAQDGLWTLPGGWADPNESPAESVTREVSEEAGFATRAVKLLAVFDRAKHAHVPLHAFHVYKLLIRCEIESGAPRPEPRDPRSRVFSGGRDSGPFDGARDAVADRPLL